MNGQSPHVGQQKAVTNNMSQAWRQLFKGYTYKLDLGVP